MQALSRFENVTVLYGHIHREDVHVEPHARHYAARSLIFAFRDPEKTAEKTPIPFDKEHPFRNLGLRLVHAGPGAAAPDTLREHSGTEGFQQLLKPTEA